MRCACDTWWSLSYIHSTIKKNMSFKVKSLVFSLLIFCCTNLIEAQNYSGSISGREAPNFRLLSIDGDLIELKSYIGNGPILICFWSSCCKSAVAQIDAFLGLFDKYKSDGFSMIAIATDSEKTVAKVKPFAKIKGYKFPVLYDTEGSVSRIYYAYDLPFSVVINKSGKIIHSKTGYMKGDEIELSELIEKILIK